MKVLVTGANGQLGGEICFLQGEFKDLNFVFVDKNALDIIDEKAVFSTLCQGKFDAVINCAAFTAVDKAQNESQKAFGVNEKGALHLAKACKMSGARLVHISTDYVFDGKASKPLAESAVSAPLGVYGASKRAGELAILSENLSKSCIIRTSWLYSEFGSNFVKTIARLALLKDEISVVSDQVGSPTNARDLARAICAILPKLDTLNGTEIFHYANEGVASWWEFACEIVRILGASCVVKSVSSSEYLAMNADKIIAPRPFYSVLDTSKIKAHFKLKIPQWKESLGKFDFSKI